MRVICINDANRPKQIPPEKWIKEGEIYTIIGTTLMNIQKNKIGVKLLEIELGQSCFPYEYFDAERFRPAAEDLQLELAEEKVCLEDI